jgi:hypothetical protein
MFFAILVIELFIDDITEVDISDSWLKLFIDICRSNMSEMLIALRLLRIIAIFDLATAVNSSIADTRAEKLTPFFGATKYAPDTPVRVSKLVVGL